MYKNKSAKISIETLIVVVIVFLTVGVLSYVLFTGEGSLSQRVKGNVVKLKSYMPNASIFGSGEVKVSQTVIPNEHLIAIKNLINGINSTLLSNKKDCFTRYGELPDLGYSGTSIEFRYENGRTTMHVYGGVDGRKLVPELTTEFENMIPCVIAGSDTVAENFFDKFINEDEISSGYYYPTNYVRIFYDQKKGSPHLACHHGNRIMTIPIKIDDRMTYDQGPNYYCNNFEDAGIFFSPDNRHICFIPTNDRTDADEHGIENDYVTTISRKLDKGELKQC